MRKFLKNTISISFLFLSLLVCLIILRATIVRSHSWELPAQKHIMFMGASHLNHAIDDSMTKSAVNWTKGSERYMFTYIKLERLLKQNPQLDTVFLELAPTDLWAETDYKYFDEKEQAGFVPYYWPLFDFDNLSIYKSQPIQVLSSICSHLLDFKGLTRESYWELLGGYNNVSDVMDITKVKPKIDSNKGFGQKINYLYLNKIIDLCKDKGVKLIFLETPTYHPEYYYDVDYFYKAYRENFSDIEFADYSKWSIPLDEMYDAHHLNHKGAVRFTNEIKRRYNIK